jgi:hypothetical protein
MAELGSCFNRHAKRGEHDNGTRNLIDICNPKFRNKVQDLDKPGTSGRKKQPLPPFLPDSIGLNRPTSPQYLLTEGSQKTYTQHTHTHRSTPFLIYDFQHTSKRVCKTENSQSKQTFTHQSREEIIIIIEEANRQRKQPKTRKRTTNLRTPSITDTAKRQSHRLPSK